MRLRTIIPTATPIAAKPPAPIPLLPGEPELSGAMGVDVLTVGLSEGCTGTREGGGGASLIADGGGTKGGTRFDGDGLGRELGGESLGGGGELRGDPDAGGGGESAGGEVEDDGGDELSGGCLLGGGGGGLIGDNGGDCGGDGRTVGGSI